MSQDLVRLLNDTDLWWSIGKGRVRRDEPLFGCIIQEPRIDGRRLVATQGPDLADCVVRAIMAAHAPAAAPPLPASDTPLTGDAP